LGDFHFQRFSHCNHNWKTAENENRKKTYRKLGLVGHKSVPKWYVFQNLQNKIHMLGFSEKKSKKYHIFRSGQNMCLP